MHRPHDRVDQAQPKCRLVEEKLEDFNTVKHYDLVRVSLVFHLVGYDLFAFLFRLKPPGKKCSLPILLSSDRIEDGLMYNITPALILAALGTLFVSAGSASAGSAPVGLWIDHTGRAGIQITKCGKGLCGYIAWLKDAKKAEACGVQVIGDVKQMRDGTWDSGWIYDPEANSKYYVELKPLGSKKLRVMRYVRTKFQSKSMIWKRAAIGFTKCTKPGAEKAARGRWINKFLADPPEPKT